MVRFLHYLVSWLFLFFCSLHAQDDKNEQLATESGNSTQFDFFEFYKQNPINLLKTNVKVLAGLPSITPSLAKRIIGFVKSHPNVTYQLIADSLNISTDLLSILKECTTLGSSKSSQTVLYRARNSLLLTKQKGYSTGAFQGDELDLYQRLTFNYNNVQCGILSNKDGGEVGITNWLGGYIHYNPSQQTNIIVGDFTVESGAGLLLWKSFGSRKGPDVLSPPTQFGSRIHPYRSTIDYRFFRGVGAEHAFSIADSSSIKLRAVYSALRRTATIDSATQEVTSLDIDGMYRTESEIAKRNTLNENALAATLEFSSSAFTVGVNALQLEYSHPIRTSSVYNFVGKSGLLLSLHSQYIMSNSSFLFEAMQDNNKNLGVRAGAEFSREGISSSIQFRAFSPNLRSPFGYNFGEYLTPNNEIGLYVSLLWKSASSVTLLGYVDIFKSLTPRTGMYFNTAGIDCFAELRWKLSSATIVSVRTHVENKTDITTSNERKVTFNQLRSLYRAELQQILNKGEFNFRIRSEVSSVDYANVKPNDLGYSVFFDGSWNVNEFLKLGGRTSIYTTSSFASAIYQYELVAPGLFATVPVYDNGSRAFFYCKYDITTNLNLWIRYGVTAFNNRSTLGSGLTELESNADRRFTFQLDVVL